MRISCRKPQTLPNLRLLTTSGGILGVELAILAPGSVQGMQAARLVHVLLPLTILRYLTFEHEFGPRLSPN